MGMGRDATSIYENWKIVANKWNIHHHRHYPLDHNQPHSPKWAQHSSCFCPPELEESNGS